MGIHCKERVFIFAQIEKKTPVLGPLLQSNQELLVWPPPKKKLRGMRTKWPECQHKESDVGRRQRSREIIDESTRPRTDPYKTPQQTRKE